MARVDFENDAFRPLLTRLDVCRLLNISPATLHRYVSCGKLPRPCLTAGRTVRWDIRDVQNLLISTNSQ